MGRSTLLRSASPSFRAAERARRHYDDWGQYYEAMERDGKSGRDLEHDIAYDEWKAARAIQRCFCFLKAATRVTPPIFDEKKIL